MKADLVKFGLYALLFLIIRLTNITAFPLYIDEVTHIYVTGLTLDGQLFIGLSETAKQLYIWLAAISFQFFADPILAARFVSVVAGLVTGWACYTITEQLYPGRGYLAALFYLVSPFAVLFDRMALADGVLTMLIGLSFWASLHLWRTSSVNWAIVVGLLFGLAALDKGYALFYYPLPLLLWLSLGRQISWSRIIKLLSIVYGLAAVAWLLMFSVGWWAYRDYLLKKSITGASEMMFLSRAWHFSGLIISWLSAYLTWPLVGLLIFAVIRLLLKRDRAGLVLILLAVAPLVAFALTFTDLYSRYLFPAIVPLSVMIAWAIGDLTSLIGRNRRLIEPALLMIFCLPSIFFSYRIITDPHQAPFPPADRVSYIVKAQSPQGYRELAAFIEQLADRHAKIQLLRYDLPSPLEVILTVYLSDRTQEQMEIIPIHSYEQLSPAALNRYAGQAPTLVIQNELLQPHPQLWLVDSFTASRQRAQTDIYQWLLPPDFALHWFQQGGAPQPRVGWLPVETRLTASGGELVEWPAPADYLLVTPRLVAGQPALFEPFITVENGALRLNQPPPEWRLAFVASEFMLFQRRPPAHPAEIMLGDSIRLEGHDLSTTHLSAGQMLHLTLYWRSLAPLSESYAVFVHLLDETGRLAAQVDEPPLWSTSLWQADTRLADRHTLFLDPAILPPGEYRIAVGLYQPLTMERLPVRAREQPIINNAVILAEIER